MTRTQDVLLDILNPVRDIYLSRILEEMSAALDRDFVCKTDMPRRTHGGEMLRSGALNLPERYDLYTEHNGHPRAFDVEDGLQVRFDPVFTRLKNGAPVSISPFRWNALPIYVVVGDQGTDWQPVRHWFLEAFQPRFEDDTPEFHGVIHRCHGPVAKGSGWTFEVDLGSAPVDCLTDLLTALDACHATKVSLGTVTTSATDDA
ncbi:MAG: hypothetical protein AAFQ51_05075 [Pseudomonadota bacterium]